MTRKQSRHGQRCLEKALFGRPAQPAPPELSLDEQVAAARRRLMAPMSKSARAIEERALNRLLARQHVRKILEEETNG